MWKRTTLCSSYSIILAWLRSFSCMSLSLASLLNLVRHYKSCPAYMFTLKLQTYSTSHNSHPNFIAFLRNSSGRMKFNSAAFNISAIMSSGVSGAPQFSLTCALLASKPILRAIMDDVSQYIKRLEEDQSKMGGTLRLRRAG